MKINIVLDVRTDHKDPELLVTAWLYDMAEAGIEVTDMEDPSEVMGEFSFAHEGFIVSKG